MAQKLNKVRSWRKRSRGLMFGIDLIGGLVMIAAAVMLLLPSRPREPTFTVPEEAIPIRGSNVIGDPHAALGMVVFTDLQCPACKAFALNTLPLLEMEYVSTGRLLIAFKHLPLDSIHAVARNAAVAAECAAEQGQFKAFHDLAFQRQKELKTLELSELARILGLDLERFASCRKSAIDERVASDHKLAERLGFRATPTVVIGRLVGGEHLEATAGFQGGVSYPRLQSMLKAAAGPSRSTVSTLVTIALPAGGLLVFTSVWYWRRRKIT